MPGRFWLEEFWLFRYFWPVGPVDDADESEPALPEAFCNGDDGWKIIEQKGERKGRSDDP